VRLTDACKKWKPYLPISNWSQTQLIKDAYYHTSHTHTDDTDRAAAAEGGECLFYERAVECRAAAGFLYSIPWYTPYGIRVYTFRQRAEGIFSILSIPIVGGWVFPVGCFPPCGVFPRGVWGLPPSGSFVARGCYLSVSDVFPALWRPGAWPTARPTAWQRLAWSCCCRPAQHAQRSRTSPTSW